MKAGVLKHHLTSAVKKNDGHQNSSDKKKWTIKLLVCIKVSNEKIVEYNKI